LQHYAANCGIVRKARQALTRFDQAAARGLRCRAAAVAACPCVCYSWLGEEAREGRAGEAGRRHLAASLRPDPKAGLTSRL
jgi:hypothetical protein